MEPTGGKAMPTRPPEAEGIEQFLTRAAAAGFREMWLSIGKDEQSGLVVAHVSPRCDDADASMAAKQLGVTTRSFYVDGDNVHPADQTMTFSEAIMRSGMSDAQKLKWLYEACRDWEAQAIADAADPSPAPASPEPAA
jgi:hypothetical protein